MQLKSNSKPLAFAVLRRVATRSKRRQFLWQPGAKKRLCEVANRLKPAGVSRALGFKNKRQKAFRASKMAFQPGILA